MPAGLAHPHRRFTPGDTVTLDLAVRPRLTAPDARIDAVRGCAAIERGPVVYCLESVELPPGLGPDTLRLDAGAAPADRDGGVGITCRVVPAEDTAWPYAPRPATDPAGDPITVTLRPYHDWASRGPSTMRVWIPLAD
ncbi:hypothetical protein ACQP2E_22840 [Actinoplanes sp. CA-015351]|uniref:hypothetical protein n=1 Tax=Actinoplanes sp. CA-015351 TaxID=3239897 RepID=UPI003D992662